MDENDYKVGDYDNHILRKILARLKQLVGLSSASSEVTLTVSDVQIGAVELKDADTDTRAKVRSSDPAAGDNGLVVRNIPSGTQAISAASLPLPAGAATQATLQNVETYVSEIPAQGQATMAASMPVVIASNQTPVSVTGPLTDAQLRATPVPVSGTVTATGPLTDAQLRATPVPVSTKTALTAASPLQDAVGPVSGTLVSANANRKGLIISNVGAFRFSLAFGTAAGLDAGVTLYPGDTWQMNEYSFSTATVNAIASGSSGLGAFQEFT